MRMHKWLKEQGGRPVSQPEVCCHLLVSKTNFRERNNFAPETFTAHICELNGSKICVLICSNCSTQIKLWKDRRHCHIFWFHIRMDLQTSHWPPLVWSRKIQLLQSAFITLIWVLSTCNQGIVLLMRLWNLASLVTQEHIFWWVAQGSTLRCCHELLPEFRCLSCSSNLHVWLSTYALLFHYCSENDLCCGRVLIGLALQCVRALACVCVRVCTSTRMFAYVYVSMLTAWVVSARPSTCGSPSVWVALFSVPNMRSVPPHPRPALLGSVRPCPPQTGPQQGVSHLLWLKRVY